VTNVVVNTDAWSLISLASTRREIDTLSTPLGKHFGEICGLDSWRIQIIGTIYSFFCMVDTVLGGTIILRGALICFFCTGTLYMIDSCCLTQFCGSGMSIPDPDFILSRILPVPRRLFIPALQ
jgi:hypothetical protein